MEYIFAENSLRLFRGSWGGKKGTRDLAEIAWRRPAHVSGFGAWLELPTAWHEYRQARVVFDFGMLAIYLMFPWRRLYPDYYQCSGPRFGFQLFEDLFWIYHGQSTGKPKDGSKTTFYMPWHWKHCTHEVLNADGEWEPYVGSWEERLDGKSPDGRVTSTHDYTYTLKSGEVQRRKATIYVNRRIWKRSWWWPRTMERRSIDVEFSGEVGEGSGSWKGGTVGCGYDLLPNETALECLRRMEREREFR